MTATTGSVRVLTPLERSRTLTEDVYRRIRTAIVNRTLAPGERLTESGLAELLGVSKTPVREALVRLREVGLVRPDGRRGVSVVDLSETAIGDAYEVREALELAGVEKAVESNDAEAVLEIERFAARSIQAAKIGDVDGFARWDADFHLGLARLSGNAHLVKLLRDTLDLIAAIRQVQTSHLHASEACAAVHSEILEALQQRNADECARRLRRHIRAGRDRDTVEPPAPSP